MYWKTTLILLIAISATRCTSDKTQKYEAKTARVSFFDEQTVEENDHKRIKFQEDYSSNAIQFYEKAEINNNNILGNNVIFQDSTQNDIKRIPNETLNIYNLDSEIQDNKLQGQRKKRRRRRPKQQLQEQFYDYGAAQGYPASPMYPSYYPGFNRRPIHRQPRPYPTEDTLTSITTAFSSIARHDDLQCVPRLLCEVASGKTVVPSAVEGVLDKVVDLQPLVTLIAAYSGLHTSPAFFFGRAILLGMASKGKSNLCYEAYPLCPPETEQLVHYLNNHNGGFFRFFNNPQQGHQPQDLQQFLGHLSNIPQSYGLYQPGLQGQQYGLLNNPPQNFGFQQNNLQNGVLNPQNGFNGNRFPNHQPNNDYYNLQQQYLNQKRYGYGYAKQSDLAKVNKAQYNKENKIQRRILVNSNNNDDYLTDKTTWTFPVNQRNSRRINFPKETRVQDNGAGGFAFPEKQSNRPHIEHYNYPTVVVQNKLPSYAVVENVDESDPVNVVNENKNSIKVNNNGVELVYVVRGNGDVNNPEVIALRPGQKVEK